MNPYYYWFFAIYHIYAKCSKDKDFYIFATGMFSIIGSFLGYVIIDSFFQNIFQSEAFNKSLFYTLSLFYGVSMLNVLLFIIKRKHQILYKEVYLANRKRWKDIIAIIFSILVFLSFFYQLGIIEGWIDVFKNNNS